ncbi:flagellar hook-basal body protein [Arcobacteraceae bacterium]|nr:flagellar hook-basal body protein [Arcobacteraceae bacterium]
MTQGIHQLTASMVNQLNRVDVISNNLANLNTVGFKEEHLSEGTFNRYLKQQEIKDETILKESLMMDTIPKIDGSFKNESVGAIKQTGNGLDFALKDKNMFFKIRNEQGETEYTRDGSFKSIDGTLINQNGYPVLNSNNEEISIDDPDFAANIAVSKIDFTNVDKLGNNNYKVIDNTQVELVANSGEYVLQGALEHSNVNSIRTMVGLIEAQRKFEQSQKAINTIDEINGTVIDSIGKS